jgi:hypothetical protein
LLIDFFAFSKADAADTADVTNVADCTVDTGEIYILLTFGVITIDRV